MPDEQCPLCGKHAQRRDQGRNQVTQVACERCRDYRITEEAADEVTHPDFEESKRAMLSALTREASEQGRIITICSSEYKAEEGKEGIAIADLLALFPRSIPERIDRALQNLERKSSHFGAPIRVDDSKDWPLFFAENGDALRFTIEHMVQSGLIQEAFPPDQGGGEYALTVKGCDRIEELRHVRPESRQAFVAMRFHPDMDEAWHALDTAVKEAELNLHAWRSDMVQFNEKIDDRIIAEIRRSRFMVADVTHHRQAVYFEAGFAMGLGLPVIFTCREDDLNDCSFDTRQYNHIVWKSPEDLREQLRDRIRATIVDIPPSRRGA